MPSSERDLLRQLYFDSWKKHLAHQATDALEQQIIAVIKEHPEYHALLENEEAALHADFLPEMGDTNPFLHMGMHLGLRDQVSTGLPEGIAELYQRLTTLKGIHDAEHAMMECLAEMIWQMQHNKTMFDESAYMDCMNNLLR